LPDNVDSRRSELAEKLSTAIRAHDPLPKFNRQLTLDDAYALQHSVTKCRAGNRVGGIKAGVTAAPMQDLLGLNHALIASLYADGEVEAGDTIKYLNGRKVECEFAAIVDDIGLPKAIAPAIEVVYVNFQRSSDLCAESLVASNLGADLYMLGDFAPWDDDFAELTVTLTCDGTVVNEAPMTDAFGGPRAGVRWMWREARKREFRLGHRTLMLLGACGKPVDAAPGKYRADFGVLGAVEFIVQTPVR
jgi:2-keto-4-pentenoate hydratase